METRSTARSWSTNFSRWSALLVIGLLLINGGRSAQGQEVEVWEFSPYKVGIWMVIDPAIDKSAISQAEMQQEILSGLRRTFGATWRAEFLDVPSNILPALERGVSQVAIDDISSLDLVMLIAKENEQLKTLRVFETALDQLNAIGITAGDLQQLQADTTDRTEDEIVAKLLGKATEKFDDYEQLLAAVKDQQVSAVMVPRLQVTQMSNAMRPIATTLPWHTERFLREYDKLFLMRCALEGEAFSLEVRELDCPMRQFGPLVTETTVAWSNISQLMCSLTVTAFAPVARIEEVNGRLVSMLNRAGGLAIGENPALIKAGEVLQPMIRREDRRGATMMLEPIPWTYIGVTKADGVNVEGTAYSALGNVLQGKQTRRAQRVALRVRPLSNASDVQIVVRTRPDETQPGCQIYQRDLLTDDMSFVGHTDWRGVITIERPAVLGSLLPEEVKIKQLEARRAAAAAADKAAMEAEAARREATKKAEAAADAAVEEADVRGAESKPAPPPEAKMVEGGAAAAVATPAVAMPPELSDEQLKKVAVHLRQPLVLLYVKSGDVILAKLPLVPGLNEVDLADLPSDSVRLDAEAHFKGFQGEVLDLIGKRAIVTARMSKILKDRKYAEAEQLIREVTLMPDYKTMSDKLNALHSRLIDDTRNSASPGAKSRIDRMLVTTREILQQYVEKDLPQQLRADMEAARGRAAAEDKAAAEAKAAEEANAAAAVPAK